MHHSSSRHLYGFDSFEGLVGVDEKDSTNIDMPHRVNGGLKGNRASFFHTFELFKKDTLIPSRFHVIEGDICTIFETFLHENSGVRFSFCLMDMDIYKPTKTVLDSLYEIMVPGGIIVFDEYSIPEWPGETKAVDEFVKNHTIQLNSLPWTFAPAAYTVIQ